MKRFVCFLLAVMMVAAMIPAAAITANAASEWTTSAKAINILKEFEGFEEFQYASGGQYYIGYGTQINNGDYPTGISKEDATALLKKHLTDKVDPVINAFTKKNNLNLTSYQHDALALFVYNYGSIPTALSEAVRTGKTGNQFINTIAQFYGSSPAGENFKGLINRRLAEANMYLNGDYAYNKPAAYTYVILDINGNEKVEATDKVIAYNANAPQTLAEVPSVGSGKVFLGWHFDDADAKAGVLGDQVTKLDSNTAGKTLIANIVAKNTEATVNYTINASDLVSRNYYKEPIAKADYASQIDEKKRGTFADYEELKVTKEKMVDGVKWLYVKGYREPDYATVSGWVYLGELPEYDKVTNTPIHTATITAATLNIRAGATEDSDIIGTLSKGQTVNIYKTQVEKTEYGNKLWGKVIDTLGVTGWINLAYADVKDTTGSNDSANGRIGTIINTEEVNVRANADVSAAKLTSLSKGTKVTILETENNDGKMWAQVQWTGLKDGYTKGWVYMFYIEVEGYEHTEPGASADNVLYSGVVTSNINLNVRNDADIYAACVGSLPNGTKVNVYEIVNNGGMSWGRIGEDRWVCTAYLNMTKVDGPAAGAPPVTEIQGTVTANTLSVLKNYNSNAAAVGTLKKGDMVVILEKNTEKTETGSRIWGRINKDGLEGWVNLAYVNLKTVTTVAPSTGSSDSYNGEATPGVIANCLSVNVRTAAGVGNNAITKLKNGTSVVVYDRVTKDAAPWARITWNNGANEGWVCLNYVTLNAGGTNAGTTPEGGLVGGTNTNTISVTGYVNNVYLNVRSGAGLGYAQIGTLNQGAKVTVFEQMVADGMIWGRINYNNATGWVCMSYITVESASTTGKGVMGTVARCFAAVNVRSAPGTGNALVGTIQVGSRVEVFETRQHGTQMWGRVAQGWVCMDYILLDSELPPGTALDATVPTTEATVPTTAPDVTINRDNEISYIINGTVATGGDDLNVRNDTNSNSIRVGTIKNGEALTILAVKNNNAELWGRVDQYATAGWINMAYVDYTVKGFVNTDEQAIYADDNTFSTVKGTLALNTEVIIKKLTVNGATVYGWYQNAGTGLAGWIPMGRVSNEKIEVLPTYKSTTDPVGANDVKGTTNMAITAYAATNNSKEVFYLGSGVTVYIGEIDLEAGIVWGKIKANGVEGWVNLNAVTFYFAGTVNTAELNVRNAKNTADPENILGVLVSGESIAICELSFDGSGTLWGKVVGNANTDLNGGYVMMQYVAHSVDIQTK
ncbi:MAG: SH3 domain-containing protein [Oscillospiraceae bacterium]|nr:SH3 domain-containing protein [Oscillospiraceae bacterium]